MSRDLRFSSRFGEGLLLALLSTLLTPVAGPVTQSINSEHQAIDIACRKGAVVRAAHDGHGGSSWNSRMGWTFVLHGEGGMKSSYSHLQKAAGKGTYKQGDVIGRCGNTGTWSSGTHLHFEMEPISHLKGFHRFAKALPENRNTANNQSTLLALIKERGIHVDRLQRCGPGRQLAAYNFAAQRLCLVKSLDNNPALFNKVLAHEAVHIAQDCLGGLMTTYSASIADHLKRRGGFSETAIKKFFNRHPINQKHFEQATASLSPAQKQLEYEAYILQNEKPLVISLLKKQCTKAEAPSIQR